MASDRMYGDSDVGTPASQTWHLASPPDVSADGTSHRRLTPANLAPPHHGPASQVLAPKFRPKRQNVGTFL